MEELFNQILFLDESLKHLENSISINEQNTQAARKRFRSGVNLETDLKEFEIRGIELASEREDLRGLRRDAAILFSGFLGLTDSKNLSLNGKLTNVCLKDSPESLMIQLETQSPEIKETQLRYDAADYLSRNSLSPFLPSLNFKTTFGYPEFRDVEKSSQVGPQWAIQLLARWELGAESFAERSLLASVRIQEEAKRDRLTIEKKSQIEQVLNRFSTATNRLALEKDMVMNTERFYNLVDKEYKRGVRNSADLKNAEKEFLETKFRLSKFKLFISNNRIDLERALGKSIETTVCAQDFSKIFDQKPALKKETNRAKSDPK